MGKPFEGRPGTYLQVRNRASEKGAVIADPRTTERRDHPEPLHGDLHRRPFHGTAIVSAQDHGADETALRPDGFFQNAGGVRCALALINLPADSLSAVDVDDQVEIEELTRDRAWNPGDIP
jgi:hypothetical protein